MLISGVKQYLPIGGGIALALFAAWAWRVDSLRAGYKAQRDAERQAHARTIHNYTEAQKLAEIAFTVKIEAIQKRNKELNDEADSRVAALRADYADRVRKLPKAAQCSAGSAGMPEANGTESTNGPGGDAVILDRSDALICADNTSRLQAAHDWALEIMGEPQ